MRSLDTPRSRSFHSYPRCHRWIPLPAGGATGKQMNEAAASLVRIMEGYESYWRGESLSLSIFYPDIPREHHPPVPHACEPPSRQCHQRVLRPSLRQPRTRFLPRSTRPHSPNPHLRCWIIPVNLPIAHPSLSVLLSANASVSTLWLFPLTRFLSAVGVFAPVVFLPRAFVVFTAPFSTRASSSPISSSEFPSSWPASSYPSCSSASFSSRQIPSVSCASLLVLFLRHTGSLPPAHACP